jgi:hypothetical protein
MRSAQIRPKTSRFSAGGRKSPEQQAGAVSGTLFRIAQRSVGRLGGGELDSDAGEAYFELLRELLVFLTSVADRLAHDRFDAGTRAEFTTALVLHVAATLADHEHDRLGAPALGQPEPHGRFIGLFNEVSAYYAEFDGEFGRSEFTPDFAFVSYLGHRLESTSADAGFREAVEHYVGEEAAFAVALVQRAMRELQAMPRRQRHASIGAG